MENPIALRAIRVLAPPMGSRPAVASRIRLRRRPIGMRRYGLWRGYRPGDTPRVSTSSRYNKLLANSASFERSPFESVTVAAMSTPLNLLITYVRPLLSAST